MAEKKRKYLKVAAEAVADIATMGHYSMGKTVERMQIKMLCERKGGKWVKGKCVPGSQIRTGKKKYPSKSPERSS